MSFSKDVKLEIAENKPLRLNHKFAMAYGLFLYSNYFNEEEISLKTQQKEVVDIFTWLASSILGKTTTVRVSELKTAGKAVFRVCLPKKTERVRLLNVIEEKKNELDLLNTTKTEEVHAFLAGAFLASGNITDPKKAYHVEFVVKEQIKVAVLIFLLNKYIPNFSITTRRNNQVLYCKEVARIQDLLAMIGATKASLAMVEVEMYKGIRNTANRQTNCETANIGKQVTASTSQIMDIRFILDTKGEDILTVIQKETAILRMNYPEASLQELVELSSTKVSRSGLHHRLASLTKMAEEIRELQKQGEHNV